MTISKVEKSPHSNQGISLYRQMPTNYLAKKISSISSAIIETLSCLFGYYLWNRIFFAFTGKPWIVKTTDPQNLPKIDTRDAQYTESSHLETIRQAKYKIHSTVYNKHKLAETFKGMTQKDENKEEDGNIDKEQQDQKSLWNAQLEKEAVLLAVNKDISRTYSIQTPNETIRGNNEAEKAYAFINKIYQNEQTSLKILSLMQQGGFGAVTDELTHRFFGAFLNTARESSNTYQPTGSSTAPISIELNKEQTQIASVKLKVPFTLQKITAGMTDPLQESLGTIQTTTTFFIGDMKNPSMKTEWYFT